MYSHGIALLAIAEAYAITSDDRLKDAVVRGCNYTLQAQNPITVAGGTITDTPEILVI